MSVPVSINIVEALRRSGWSGLGDDLLEIVNANPDLVTPIDLDPGLEALEARVAALEAAAPSHEVNVADYPDLASAVAAAEALHPRATLRLPLGVTEGVLDLSNTDLNVVGAGAGTILRQPAGHVGPVVDMTRWGYGGNAVFRAQAKDFVIEGNGEVNPENVGMLHRESGACEWSNISIRNTGGPCAQGGGHGLGIMTGLVFERPVDAGVNDTPYWLVDDWFNGMLVQGCGFRSLTSDDDGSAVWKIETTSQYVPHDTTISGCWLEYQHAPDGGAIWDFAVNEFRIETPLSFDSGIGVGAATLRLNPAHASDYGGNYVWGVIPGPGNHTDRWGVDLLQPRNGVVGTKGYRNNCVRFGPGVKWCSVHFTGRVSGASNESGFVDDSGTGMNTVIDGTLGSLYGF